MIKGGKHSRNEEAITILAFNVRKYRNMKNLTIQELANLLNVDYSQVGRIERGVINTNISMVFDIAAALDISASQLLEK